MKKNKKIILVGPPEAGKTTIRDVFFENANPLYLLRNPLEPSRGINSNVYSIFNSNIGIFDLAGQENITWFFNNTVEVFRESDLIICVFDIQNSLEYITNFLIVIDRIKREFLSKTSNLLVFLHKVDLFNYSYINHKFKVINDFFTIQHQIGSGFKIYFTSITEEFFFDTFSIITNILKQICQGDIIPITTTEFQNLEKEVLILLRFDALTKYHIKDLIDKFKIDSNEAIYHLKRLEELAFLKIYENYNYFQLTERAIFLKRGIEKNQKNIDKDRFNMCIDLLYIFQNVINIMV